MRAPVRAKFRVLTIKREWDGKWAVEMRPINRGRGKDPENSLFWDATPSGDATLEFPAEPDMEIGAYYYMDLIPDDEGDTHLDCLKFHRGGGIGVSFSRGHTAPHPVWPADDRLLWMYDRLEMSIGGGDDFDLRDSMGANFGLPDDGAWRLEVTFSEPSDD